MPIKFSHWQIAILLYLITAWNSVGYHHADEHYQILEFANLKLGNASVADMPWEYKAEMRPGLQPMLTVGIISTLNQIGISDPFTQAFLLRLLSGMLTLALFWQWSTTLPPDIARRWIWLVCFLWCMPYLSVRYSSEAWSALSFGVGCLYCYRSKTNRNMFLAGLLMGCSFHFRYQIAFAILGVLFWFIFHEKQPTKQILYWILGGIVAFVLGTFADYLFYGKWVIPAWNYLKINILEGKASEFGKMPWWWYFTEYLMSMAYIIGLALLVLATIGYKKMRGHILVWAMIPFIIGHTLIAHKEIRFLFPAISALILLAATGWDIVAFKYQQNRVYRYTKGILLFVNTALLVVVLVRPAMEAVPYYAYLNQHAKDQKQVLYVEKTNPYLPANIPISFYNPKHIEAIKLGKLDRLTSDTSSIILQNGDFILSEKMYEPLFNNNPKFRRVYCLFPDWITAINVGGWVERSRIWSLYRYNDSN
jgi:phosphatidylinositol glycan class B